VTSLDLLRSDLRDADYTADRYARQAENSVEPKAAVFLRLSDSYRKIASAIAVQIDELSEIEKASRELSELPAKYDSQHIGSALALSIAQVVNKKSQEAA
jgi:hypothetical protein